jgi:hypothetical protein
MKKSQRASETQSRIIKTLQSSQLEDATLLPRRPDILLPATSLEDQIKKINTLKCILSDPFRKPTRTAKSFLKDAIAQYELIYKASLGMPTYTDNATLQAEASNDIPTVPLSGLVPIQRTAYIVKSATQGATAGGFFTTLVPGDFSPWCSQANVFRVKKMTSWTVPRVDSGVNVASFAGVAVPASAGSAGTEVLPTWSENFEPVGQGFAGITTTFPLGAYPLYLTSDTTTICSHYTSLGGTGGVTGVPVVFHVVIETLI